MLNSVKGCWEEWLLKKNCKGLLWNSTRTSANKQHHTSVVVMENSTSCVHSQDIDNIPGWNRKCSSEVFNITTSSSRLRYYVYISEASFCRSFLLFFNVMLLHSLSFFKWVSFFLCFFTLLTWFINSQTDTKPWQRGFGEIWHSKCIIQPTLKTNNEVKHEPTIETQMTTAPHTNLYMFHCSSVEWICKWRSWTYCMTIEH